VTEKRTVKMETMKKGYVVVSYLIIQSNLPRDGLVLFKFMVFKATFNNISVILWWSVLLVEETGVHGENHQPAVSH
jgi:hypothetical protein